MDGQSAYRTRVDTRTQAPLSLGGGYYTAPELADWLCEWAIRDSTDHVLEPACGDGVFLTSALTRLASLGEPSPVAASEKLTGIEVVGSEADLARQRLTDRFGSGIVDTVHTGDFFEYWMDSRRVKYDVVVGNPPFIRYQNFPEPYRSRAMSIMAELGLRPNRLTNIWVPFVVASASSLRPGGRLALVLPAELLQVSYAAQLRSFLTRHFASLDIVACNELFFSNADQEVLLLLADGAFTRSSESDECRISMTEASTVNEVIHRSSESVLLRTKPKTIRHDSEKWLKYFLTDYEISLMRELRDSPATENLGRFASVDVGVVTGRNSFFVITDQDIQRYSLQGYTKPIVSRSDQLRGARFRTQDWETTATAGRRVNLLNLEPLGGDLPTEALRRYVAMGEDLGVHEGYKCSIRTPWYAVRSVWEPNGFLLRQIHDFPKAVLNQSDATSTDTIHRLHCRIHPDLVVANTYTYLTAASAEIEGRSYGGGVLELEPTEAERLLMPSKILPSIPIGECDRLMRSGKSEELLEVNSQQLLVNRLGLSKSECVTLRDIWKKMQQRRTTRRRRRSRVSR